MTEVSRNGWPFIACNHKIISDTPVSANVCACMYEGMNYLPSVGAMDEKSNYIKSQSKLQTLHASDSNRKENLC
jgi:hypothetical protein